MQSVNKVAGAHKSKEEAESIVVKSKAVEETTKVETRAKAEVVERDNKERVGSGNNVSTDIADILGYEYSDEQTYSLIFGEELSQYGVVLKSNKSEDELQEYSENLSSVKDIKLSDNNVVDISNTTGQKEQTLNNNIEQVTEETNNESTGDEETKASEVALTSSEETVQAVEETAPAQITIVDQSEALLAINEPDESYTGAIVALAPEDRDLLERLVMGEAGAEGYEGSALVAQCIRDTMVYKGFTSVAQVRQSLKYSGSIDKEPNENVKNAVAYVFDQGGVVIKHKIFYFYAPRWCTSKWHESQHFLIEYGGHRFFSSW